MSTTSTAWRPDEYVDILFADEINADVRSIGRLTVDLFSSDAGTKCDVNQSDAEEFDYDSPSQNVVICMAMTDGEVGGGDTEWTIDDNAKEDNTSLDNDV